jgi:hypothetical protein
MVLRGSRVRLPPRVSPGRPARPIRAGACLHQLGWESRAFYRKKMPYDPDAPREITEGSLDPLNTQSPLAPAVLKIFQRLVAEGEIAGFLKRRYDMFKATLKGT